MRKDLQRGAATANVKTVAISNLTPRRYSFRTSNFIHLSENKIDKKIFLSAN
jgi:hypothetical protein